MRNGVQQCDRAPSRGCEMLHPHLLTEQPRGRKKLAAHDGVHDLGWQHAPSVDTLFEKQHLVGLVEDPWLAPQHVYVQNGEEVGLARGGLSVPWDLGR